MVDKNSLDAGRILSSQGRALGLQEGDYEGAQMAFNRALSIARREKDVVLEMATLATAGFVDLYHLRLKEGLARNASAIELGRDLPPSAALVYAHYGAAFMLWSTGETERVGPHAEAAVAIAEKIRDRSLWSRAAWANEFTPTATGDWETARSHNDHALSVLSSDARPLNSRILLEYEVGAFDKGEVFLERLLDLMQTTPSGPTVERGLAAFSISTANRIRSVIDRLDVAEETATEILLSPFRTPLIEYLADVALGLVAIERGDAAAAGDHYGKLKRVRDLAPSVLISTDRVLGLIAHAMTDLDGAIDHFEDALAFCRKANRPQLAWACCDYADTLRERDGEGDREKAASLLDESLAISRELGMRPLMERVLSRREILEA